MSQFVIKNIQFVRESGKNILGFVILLFGQGISGPRPIFWGIVMPGKKSGGIVKEDRNTPSIKYTKTFQDFLMSIVILFWEKIIWDRNKLSGIFWLGIVKVF